MKELFIEYHINQLQSLAKGIRLLYVEDDPVLRQTMMHFLSRHFADVQSASDGLEALQCLESGHFDIVISDLVMPRMGGDALLKQIRQNNEEQLVLIVSAYAEGERLMQLIEHGVDGVLLKPVNVKNLVRLLVNSCRAVHGKRMHHQEETL